MLQIKLSELNQVEINLLEKAKQAAENFLNKRSNRRVGAALLCDDDTIYQGASIRRTNVSNSTCAERMALDKAIFDKKFNYKMLAVVGFLDDTKPDEITSPCGLCRQILAEAQFYGETKQPIEVILASANLSNIIKTDTEELFPIPYLGK